MTTEVIIEFLKVLFPTELTINNENDLYHLDVNTAFYNKYNIIIHIDYIANLPGFVPFIRTKAYIPKAISNRFEFSKYLFTYNKFLRDLSGDQKHCHLMALQVVIYYIGFKLYKDSFVGNFILVKGTNKTNITVIAKTLDNFDDKIELEHITKELVKNVDKEQFYELFAKEYYS